MSGLDFTDQRKLHLKEVVTIPFFFAVEETQLKQPDFYKTFL